MKKYLPLLAAAVAVLLAVGGFLIWQQNTSGLKTSETQVGLAGYIIQNGEIFYVTRLTYYTGQNSPDKIVYDKQKVEGADLKTFALLPEAGPDWAKDKAHLYYEGKPMEPYSGQQTPLDVATAKVLPGRAAAFIVDSRAVYEMADYPGSYTELSGVDAATFGLVGKRCAKDKNSSYEIGYYGEFSKTEKIDEAYCNSYWPAGEGH